MHKFSASWRYNTPHTFLLQWRSLNQLSLVTLWTERNHIFSDKDFLQCFHISKWWVHLSLLSFHYLWLFTSPCLLKTTRRELFYFWLQLVPQTTALSGSHRRHQPGIFSVLKLVASTTFILFSGFRQQRVMGTDRKTAKQQKDILPSRVTFTCRLDG